MSAIRSRSFVARIRWAILPMMGYYGYAETWRDTARGLPFWWLDKLLERMPGAYLFEPPPRIRCDCGFCLGLTDEWTP